MGIDEMRLLMLMFLMCSACANQSARAALLDPSNASAPEAPLPVIQSALASTALDAGAAEQDLSKRYGCPMHPEISQAIPGKCPKCGMTLVVHSQ